jgi:hypothetical protein
VARHLAHLVGRLVRIQKEHRRLKLAARRKLGVACEEDAAL